MHKIANPFGLLLGFGTFALIVGFRVFAIYRGVKETQRDDRGVDSGVQTLFQSDRLTPELDNSGIQSLFSNKDAD